jgi:hypothetical protein
MKLGLFRLPRRRQAFDVSKTPIKSDLTRIDRLKDGGIDYSDIPPLDKSFFPKKKGRESRPHPSVAAAPSTT